MINNIQTKIYLDHIEGGNQLRNLFYCLIRDLYSELDKCSSYCSGNIKSKLQKYYFDLDQFQKQ